MRVRFNTEQNKNMHTHTCKHSHTHTHASYSPHFWPFIHTVCCNFERAPWLVCLLLSSKAFLSLSLFNSHSHTYTTFTVIRLSMRSSYTVKRFDFFNCQASHKRDRCRLCIYCCWYSAISYFQWYALCCARTHVYVLKHLFSVTMLMVACVSQQFKLTAKQ